MSLEVPVRRSVLLFALIAGSLSACHPARAPERAVGTATRPAVGHGEIRRTQLESRPATGLPGWETRLYLIEYGPGAVAPLHIHPAVGVGLVLEGDFESAFGDEASVKVHAGQSFVDPAALPHRTFRNASETAPLRFVIAYTIRSGEQIFYPGAALPAPGAEAH